MVMRARDYAQIARNVRLSESPSLKYIEDEALKAALKGKTCVYVDLKLTDEEVEFLINELDLKVQCNYSGDNATRISWGHR